MSLRSKIILFVSIFSLIPAVVIFLFSGQLSNSFVQIEQERLNLNLERIKGAFGTELTQLATINREYSAWDDTYAFVKDTSKISDYIDLNLNDTNLATIDIHFFLIYNNNKQIVASKFLDLNTNKYGDVSADFLENAESYQSHFFTESENTGLIVYKNKVYVVASRPILTSYFEGPKAGNLVIGRLLDTEIVQKWEKISSLQISYATQSNEENSGFFATTLQKAGNNDRLTDTVDKSTAYAYLILDDFNNTPVLILKTLLTRDIYKEATRLIELNILFGFIVAILYTFGAYIFYEFNFVKKVKKILDEVAHIARNNSFSARLSEQGKDELGEIVVNVNKMVESLEVADKYQKIINKELSSKSMELENKSFELEKTNKLIEQKIEEKTQELKNEKAKLLSAINSIPFGFVILDSKKEIVLYNDVLNPILMINEHKWTFDKLNHVFHGSWTLSQNVDNSVKNKRIVVLDNIEYKDRFIKISIAPILMGHKETLQSIGAIILIEDITEEKIMQRSKDEFFSIASHELRTPLSIIRGNAQLIKKYYLNEIDKHKDLDEMMSDIDTATTRMIGLVNDFLKTSKLEQNKIPFNKTTFDMIDTSIDVLNTMQNMAAAKNLKLVLTKSTKDLPKAIGDEERVKEVMMNLISNSIKFTNEGQIKVSIMPEKDFLKISVTDTGRGIPKLNQNLLFRKFQQAGDDLYTRDTEKGTGLGLYISKMMIESMGGKIYLEESSPSKGSTFTFTIPCEKSDKIQA